MAIAANNEHLHENGILREGVGFNLTEEQKMIRDLARNGAAVLMISSELPEIIGMSDRIVVMWDGTIAGELPAGSSEEALMVLATGQKPDSAAVAPVLQAADS